MVAVTLKVTEFGVGNYKPLVVTSDKLEVEMDVNEDQVTKYDEDGKAIGLNINGMRSIYRQLNSIFEQTSADENVESHDENKPISTNNDDEWE